MTDAIAEFLKRGGKIKSCPTAATVEGTAVVSEADRKRLAEHLDERKKKAAFQWGHQKEQRRSERKSRPPGMVPGGTHQPS